MTKRYVPDTNFFIQFRMAQELPWSELTDDDHVQLILVDGVISELDRHKAGGNERRSRRSRDYLELLAPLFDDHEELFVRKEGPKVSFVFAPFRPDVAPGPLPDEVADASIVNQAHRAQASLGAVEVLTADRMMTLHAKRAGLKPTLLREEWRLPPEPSAAEREVRELRRQLAEVRAVSPDLSVCIAGWSSPGPFRSNVAWRTPLPEKTVVSAVQRVAAFHPDDLHRPGQVVSYSKFGGGAYESARKQWLMDVEKDIRRLPGLLNSNDACAPMAIEIGNGGGSAAEGLLVEIEGCGEILVVEVATHESLAARTKPCASISRPPRLSDYEDFTRLGRLSERIDPFRIPPIPQPLQPREFYWNTRKGDGVGTLLGQCAEFRHHIHTERHEFLLLPVPQSEPTGPVRGAVKIRVSAKNVVKPIEMTVPVVIELDRRSALDELEAVLIKDLVH